MTNPMDHYMTPNAVFFWIVTALVIDYWSVGPDSIRDRLAFLFAWPAIYEGFNGSPLDRWTLERLRAVIDWLKDQSDGAYFAGVTTDWAVAVFVFGLFLFTIGCLMPDRFAGKLGRWARMKFPTSPVKRLNVRLWVCAILLGLLCDLPGGLVGGLLDTAVRFLSALIGPWPAGLLG